jgi:transposase
LKTTQTRSDTTTASAYGSPEGMCQCGQSQEQRPDLPQLKIALSTLAPLGVPLRTPVLAGQSAAAPLYTPEIDSSPESSGHRGLTHLGDGKRAALKTRADIVGRKDYYLGPLAAVQRPAPELERLRAPVFAEKQPVVAV